MGIYRINNKIYGIQMYNNYYDDKKVFESVLYNELNKKQIQEAINFYKSLSKEEQYVTSILVYVEVVSTYEINGQTTFMWYSSKLKELEKVFEIM
jgi:hypothetical protein